MFFMALYTIECFASLKEKSIKRTSGIYNTQIILIFLIYLLGIVTVYFQNPSNETIILIGAQLIYMILVLVFFTVIYTKMSCLVQSNMCMLLLISFIILGRLSYDKSVKQFKIVLGVTLLSLIVPYLMSRFEIWEKLTFFYCFAGIAMLISVIIVGRVTYGSMLSLELFGMTFQPSEFVKIIFVFFVAGMLHDNPKFYDVVLSAALAGTYVIILVLSKDLGSALIFFMVYSFMLYVGTKKKRYLFLCAIGGCMAAVVGYSFFSHVQQRVAAWRDPWSDIDRTGFQIAQSLFAISTGEYTGTGLYRGMPNTIPVVEKDFVFSAIAEEFGGVFAIMLILICFSCFVAFVKIAMQQTNMFYRLVSFGLGIAYAVQVILTIGGALKMIPSTGVTLPLVSYGGSSILSTLIIFSIAQGLAIVGLDNELHIKRKKKTTIKPGEGNEYTQRANRGTNSSVGNKKTHNNVNNKKYTNKRRDN